MSVWAVRQLSQKLDEFRLGSKCKPHWGQAIIGCLSLTDYTCMLIIIMLTHIIINRQRIRKSIFLKVSFVNWSLLDANFRKLVWLN